MNTVTIRKYKYSDKAALQEICRATANSRYSSSQEGLRAVSVLYNDYYTECEPENIFVAVDESDKPVGYILCSLGSFAYIKAMLGKYLRQTAKISCKFIPDALLEAITVAVLPKKFRTHLHIDILSEYQRQGIGSKLMNALRAHLNARGVDNLSVASIGRSTNGYKFYTKYGFKEVKNFGFGEVAVAISTKETK